MIADKLYDFMANPAFQHARSGNLFFPAYIYTYDPTEEYDTRHEIELLRKKLERPNNFLDTMVINIFHEFIEFLKSSKFAGSSLFDDIIDQEKEDPEEATHLINEELDSEYSEFFESLSTKIRDHFSSTDTKRVYLLIYGFGSMFPNLYTSEFLKRTEGLVKDFKVILFYPGEYDKGNYKLFNELNHDNVYRANHLNTLIGA